MFGRGRILWKLFAFLAVVGLAAAANAQGRDTIAVRLDWSPWGVQAPFYLAQHNGWFTKANLDVTLEDGNGTVTTI